MCNRFGKFSYRKEEGNTQRRLVMIVTSRPSIFLQKKKGKKRFCTTLCCCSILQLLPFNFCFGLQFNFTFICHDKKIHALCIFSTIFFPYELIDRCTFAGKESSVVPTCTVAQVPIGSNASLAPGHTTTSSSSSDV